MTTRKRPTPVGLAEHFNNDMITKNYEILLENVWNKTPTFQPLRPLSQEHTAAKRLCNMWIKQKLRNRNTKWRTQCVLLDECRQNDLDEAKLCTGCAPKVTANLTAMLHFDRFIAGNPQCTGLGATTPEASNLLRMRFLGP
eukprot:gene2749-3528_t